MNYLLQKPNQMDKHETQVNFRYWKKEVIALFPYLIADPQGHVTSYMHVGQHGAACYDHIIRKSKPATKEQRKELAKELKGLGYNLEIIKRRNRAKYLANLKN